MKKNVGVLFPVASLPSNHGIGDFGDSCYTFIKWLKKHHYSYWQILPLNPLGPGNSPYMSTCSEAIDVRYISLDYLKKEGLLDEVPDYRKTSTFIRFQACLDFKVKYLKKAFEKYMQGPTNGLKKFKTKNPWATHYATYLVFKKVNHGAKWNEWPAYQMNYFDKHNKAPRQYQKEIDFQIFMQYIAAKQWKNVLSFARRKSIKLIADCPFYVGYDSTDCWMHKDQFLFDEKYNPTMVSGVPPDVFSDVGQLWGTPIFDFNKMKEDNYSFLVNRIGFIAKTCDLLRLDHFRAWDTYCVIPAEDSDAKRGRWEVGPRYEFFDNLYKKYPKINLIAEDLGDLFPGVHELRDHYNLPGMFIYEFTIFDWEAFPTERQIVYPGTHDNQTLYGWYKSLTDEQKDMINRRLNYPKNLYQAIFDYIWNAKSLFTIFQLQDLLRIDDKGRLNYPGTIGDPNWCFKLKDFSKLKNVKYGQ